MASQPFPDHKRGIWRMKYRPDPIGKWVTITLGKDPRLKGARPPRTPPMDLLDRARELGEIEFRARHGLGPAPVRVQSLAAYIATYLQAFESSHKPGSVKQARRYLNEFLTFTAARGITSVQGVTKGACRDFVLAKSVKLSHDTLGTMLGFLSPPWARAVEDGLRTDNPWIGVRAPGKSTRSQPTFWSSEEVARIAAACSKTWQSDLVTLLANSGLRISTALALRWEWVDLAEGVVTIPASAAALVPGVKTSYSVGLRGAARRVLEKRRFASGGRGYVFENPLKPGQAIGYETAKAALQRAIKRAKVKTGTPHDLRHSFARALDRAGVPASVDKAQLGHAAARTTAIYTSVAAAEAAKLLTGFAVGEPTPSAPSRDQA